MTEGRNISERERDRRVVQRAMSIRTFCKTYGVGRTLTYTEIAAGRLKIRKAGRRSLVGHDDAEAWWQSLPAIEKASGGMTPRSLSLDAGAPGAQLIEHGPPVPINELVKTPNREERSNAGQSATDVTATKRTSRTRRERG